MAFGAQVVFLTVGFVRAEPTALTPDYTDAGVAMGVLLLVTVAGIVSFVIAMTRLQPEAAWWAATSVPAAPAVLFMIASAGMGDWFVWCAVALCVPLVSMLVCFRYERPKSQYTDGGPARGAGRASVVLSVVALAVSLFSGAGMEDIDYTGTWTNSEQGVTLTLSDPPDGPSSYTLESATCSETADWTLDHPQMTTSVQPWLLREKGAARCLPGPDSLRLLVVGGTVAEPVLGTAGPNGVFWFLTRQ
ncbi:hypothetical protein ABTX85_26090 [Streptomyces sp. NPDC096097]|uniref:hypothetical protein n=1 Tax=Streptomyces sp. NPDC096097 TaxID=3155546 RepID=UPI003328ED61